MQDGGVVTVAMGSRDVCKTSVGNGNKKNHSKTLFIFIVKQSREIRSSSFALMTACNPSYLRLVSSISFFDSVLLESHGCDVIEWVSHNMNKLHLGA